MNGKNVIGEKTNFCKLRGEKNVIFFVSSEKNWGNVTIVTLPHAQIGQLNEKDDTNFV